MCLSFVQPCKNNIEQSQIIKNLKRIDVAIIGSGMGSLTAAALLSKRGFQVTVIEQNYLAGGCTSSYWRKGFTFEAGATTLVGLGKSMPLQYVLDETGIQVNVRRLTLPMQVRINSGEIVNRYESLDEWIVEAQRVFGEHGQAPFWRECYAVSKFVWDTSLKQKRFPPSKTADILSMVKNVDLNQFKNLPYAFKSVQDLLVKHGLESNKEFVDFVNEQLLITAQNYAEEVSFLFGATALCYTNFPNYYVDGGLINLVQPFLNYIEEHGGQVLLREGVEQINKQKEGYFIKTNKSEYYADYLISGIPINNTIEVFPELRDKFSAKLMTSKQLNSAFQMGIGFKPHKIFETIHHQIHLSQPLSETGSASIFISLSHPEDTSRSDEQGLMVMSISTHVPDPDNTLIDGIKVEAAILDILEQRDFLKKESVVYQHSSTPKSWAKWTGRKWGFVGGYPQYMSIKPWQMLDARLDGHKAYMVGDTVYPGQGIPGVTLSGIIAVEKICVDWG